MQALHTVADASLNWRLSTCQRVSLGARAGNPAPHPEVGRGATRRKHRYRPWKFALTH